MSPMSTPELQYQRDSSARIYALDFPVVFDHAEGAGLFDAEAGKYLDFSSGAGTQAPVRDHPEINAAIVEPEVIVVPKALGSGMPLSALIYKEECGLAGDVRGLGAMTGLETVDPSVRHRHTGRAFPNGAFAMEAKREHVAADLAEKNKGSNGSDIRLTFLPNIGVKLERAVDILEAPLLCITGA
jgi:4-aminobutyrate aminotransferase-like enzyme